MIHVPSGKVGSTGGGQSFLETERRELNENPDRIESTSPQEFRESIGDVGVRQEYLPFTGGRRVTLTDARLVSVVKRWMELPEDVRKEVEARCLQPVS